jgi:glutamate 5-kinase
VKVVSGDFSRGDPLAVQDEAGRELARGLSAYDAADATRIAGHRSAEIEAILGWRGRDELIHRDDLVLAEGEGEDGRKTAASTAEG